MVAVPARTPAEKLSGLDWPTTGTRLSLPIDVECLLENMPGVLLEILPGLRRHGAEGCVFQETASPGMFMVVIDGTIASRSPRHYRMVVAEETGHIKLHGGVMSQLESAEEFVALQRREEWQIIERDAKSFGRAILMPLPLLTKAAEDLYPILVDIAGFRDSEAIQKYMRNRLAETFEVRPEDVNRRLKRWPCDVYARTERSIRRRSDLMLPPEHRSALDTAQLRLWDDFVEIEQPEK